MSQVDKTEQWLVWIVFDSGAELAAVRADLRKRGVPDAAVVFVVADPSDSASRWFVEWIDPSFSAADQGFVGAVPTAEAARALVLLSGASAAASLSSKPRPTGTIRVLAVGRGRASFCDIDPSLPPTGFNAFGSGSSS